MAPQSKYKTGLYFKMCKYSDETDWLTGALPAGRGRLQAAISINKATKEVDIAVDPEENSGQMLRNIFLQLESGFQALGIEKQEQNTFKMLYQTPHGTTLVPLVKGPGKKGFFARLFGF